MSTNLDGFIAASSALQGSPLGPGMIELKVCFMSGKEVMQTKVPCSTFGWEVRNSFHRSLVKSLPSIMSFPSSCSTRPCKSKELWGQGRCRAPSSRQICSLHGCLPSETPAKKLAPSRCVSPSSANSFFLETSLYWTGSRT